MDFCNNVVYFGLFEGHDPNPSKDPGYIIMSSFLIFYKWSGCQTLKVQTSQSEIESLFSYCHVNASITFASTNAVNRAADSDGWCRRSPVTLIGPLALFFSRRHLEVNEKEPQSRRSTRQEEHCSESRLCSVITCNHGQLESFSCWEVIPCFNLFLDQWPLCWLFTRFKLLLTSAPSASLCSLSLYRIFWIKFFLCVFS